MTLKEYAAVLRMIGDIAPYHEGEYLSRTTGRPGYRACYQVGQNWFWYSVSNITNIVSPQIVADAIEKGVCQREGSFKGNGFEATVRFDGHSYMLNMGSKKPNFETP